MGFGTHWKHHLKARCKEIAEELRRRYGFRFIPCYSDISYATKNEYGLFEVRAKPPVGYVTLAVYCHEVGHILLDDSRSWDAGKKTTLHEEVQAWGFAKSVFDEFGLPWAPSVSACVKTCLGTHALVDVLGVPEGGASEEIINAIKKLQELGVG